MAAPGLRMENIEAFAAEYETDLGDGASRNDRAVHYIREKWIEKQLQEREAEFSDLVPGKVFCGTWNVNGKKLEEEDPIEDWIPVEAAAGLCDIYAIGFQEMVDLNVTNVTMDGKSAQRHKFWAEKLLRHLNSNALGEKYTLTAHEHLVGILLCVFTRTELANVVSAAQIMNVPCGAMGVMGNKGGIACRLRYYDSWICFICAHLAAHRGNVEGRNANATTIIERAAFDAGAAESGSPSQISQVQPTKVMEHEFVFFIGDLNYRISVEVDTEEVFWKCTEDLDAPFLLSRDQLVLELKAGRVLQGFVEPEISFLPTYKFEPGSDRYEQRENKKRRAPAWCDRVLWYSKRENRVQTLMYRSSMSQRVSDHKPVCANFVLQARRIDKQRALAVHQNIVRTLDRWENASQPQVKLSAPHLQFGPVKYGERKCVSLQVENVGSNPAVFRFVPKENPDDPSPFVCKHWLRLEPAFGMLLPGEAKSITATCSIDVQTARRVALAEDSLEDILILRFEGGRDCFIDVSAEYLRSCFGCSLEELVVASAPIRETPIGAPSAEGDETRTVQAVPKELWRILDSLQTTGKEVSDIFFGQGHPEEVTAIREALDTGAELPTHTPHSMAEVLLSFLASLASPIIPQSVAVSLEAEYTTQNLQPWTRRFLERLPPANYNTFVYLVSFFRYLLEYKVKNRLTPTKIASTLSKALLASVPDEMVKESSKVAGGLLICSFEDTIEGTDELSDLQMNGAKVTPSQRRSNLDMIVVHLLTTSVI